MRYADVLEAGVDREAQGDQGWLVAIEALRRISGALAKIPGQPACLVLCPRRGADWEDEDIAFVEAAAVRQQATGMQLVLVSTDSRGPLPPHWSIAWDGPGEPADAPSSSLAPPQSATRLIGLVPGVVNEDVLMSFGFEFSELRSAMLALPAGHYLVPPEWRLPIDKASRLDYDRIAAHSQSHPWLAAFAQYRGNNFFIDPVFLAEQAWERFAQGGGGIGLRLLGRARTCVSTRTDRAAHDAQLQGMRIALGRFEDTAAEPDPPPGLPKPLETFLRMAKGWGLAMQTPPEPERALDYLQGPHAHGSSQMRSDRLPSSPDEEREHLFLLNIRALAQMKVGDLGAALNSEKEIKRRAEALEQRDWTLEYINAINLARLHRRLGDLKGSAEWYEIAFATTAGARTWPEAVHANVWEAIIAAERGDSVDSGRAWIRTALHWAAAEAPEAIGSRVAAAILGRRPEPGEDLTESASARLLESVRAAWTEAGQEIHEEDSKVTPPVTSLSAVAKVGDLPAMKAAIGAPGWSVLLASTPPFHTGFASSHAALRRFLGGMTETAVSTPITDESLAILVDDELGSELPTTRAELITSALRLNITTVCFDGRTLQFDPTLTYELERDQRVCLGPAVWRMELETESAVVHFRRHLPPRLLGAEDAKIVRALEGCPTVSDLAGKPASVVTVMRLLKTLRRLERWRVARLFIAEDTYV